MVLFRPICYLQCYLGLSDSTQAEERDFVALLLGKKLPLKNSESFSPSDEAIVF